MTGDYFRFMVLFYGCQFLKFYSVLTAHACVCACALEDVQEDDQLFVVDDGNISHINT